MEERLKKQFAFALEIDKEKRIGRQTYCSDGDTLENDAEHAWHAALMAVLFSEYANEPVDVLKVVKMLLIHDIVEIDAGIPMPMTTKALLHRPSGSKKRQNAFTICCPMIRRRN